MSARAPQLTYEKTVAPLAPEAPKPVLPDAPKTPSRDKTVGPSRSPQATPHISASGAITASGGSSRSAARMTSAPATSAFRVPPPKPTFQQRMKTVSAIEEALGTNWLNKLGIIILVVGVALFGIYELGALGPLGKVGISFFASRVSSGGRDISREERTLSPDWPHRDRRRLGFLFFSTFAIHHVAAMRASRPRVDARLHSDAVVAVAMAAHTLQYRSQFVTGLAFLLGYTTVALSQDTVYSLSAGVVLAIGLIHCSEDGLVRTGSLRNSIELLNHLYWLYRHPGHRRGAWASLFQYHASLACSFSIGWYSAFPTLFAALRQTSKNIFPRSLRC